MREAVIVSTARTPIGKAYKGSLSKVKTPSLAAHAIRAAVDRAGAQVVVNDLSRQADGTFSADAVVNEIRSMGGTAVAAVASVSEADSAASIVQVALDSFGRIDGLINNAGIVRDKLFFNMSVDQWSDVVDVHLNGAFFMARAAAPHFKKQASGAFIHMTSTSGLIGSVGQANYAAAKIGVAGLSKCIALDMA